MEHTVDILYCFRGQAGLSLPLGSQAVVKRLDGVGVQRLHARRVVHLLNCMQGDHYIRISEGNLSLRKFCVGGWPTRTYDPGQEAI